MAAFRKSFLVLAAIVVALAGAGGTAFAQTHPGGGLVTCIAGSTPTVVRSEGLAEILGDIVLSCTTNSNLALPASLLTNFNVTLNTNVTNNINFGSGGAVTDAVLVINENTVGGPNAGPVQVGNGQQPQYGTRVSNITLRWDGVVVPTPCTVGSTAPYCPTNPQVTTLRFTNLRGNASIFATGDLSFPSAQLNATVSVTGTTNLTVTSNVLNVGNPFGGLALRFRGHEQIDPADDPLARIPITLAQCVDNCIDRDGNFITACLDTHTTGNGPATATVTVRISEGFATAFKTLGTPTDFPGLTQVEDGFLTPGSGVNNGGATQGTRFILKFFNVPAGVRVFTPTNVAGTSSAIGSDLRRLNIVKVTGTDGNGAGPFTTSGAGREVSISGGFGFTVYEVVDASSSLKGDNPFVIESLVVPVVFAYRADTANDRPAVGQAQMSVNFAPLSTINASDADAPEPRFIERNTPTTVFGIARCITNILFPFVTNQAGFDSGFAIANTSADDKGTVNQAGACTLFYFGGTTGGGAAPSPQTSSSLRAGQTLTFTLSGGNSAFNIVGTPGFQGYVFARCDFQFAHGFAFITDGFGGIPTLAEGYLALVVQWNGIANSRGSINNARIGEALGH